MPERSNADRLELAVRRLLASPETGRGTRSADPEIGQLVGLADALRRLPRPGFRTNLQHQLERAATMTSPSVEQEPQVLQTATPALRVKNAAAAIEFYKAAFGAREQMRFAIGTSVAHAELVIGNAHVFLGEEAPEYGYPGPGSLGGSPVLMHLNVDDADAMVKRAVAAGARLTRPVTNEFYGDRSGQVADPFGYTWTIAQQLEELSVDEMHRRFEAMMSEQRASRTAPSFIPQGYRAVTPYIVVQNAPALIDFAKRVFDADERHRAIGSAGGVHAEIRIGDSMMMIGGGAPELAWRGRPLPTALHVYVEDVDAAFERAREAGATVLDVPRDHEYGERGAGVKDSEGNFWYLATAKGPSHIPQGLNTVNVYLHPRRAQPLIGFMKRAFGAEDVEMYASPDGVVHHARVKIGDSAIEMGEANGPYQPMPTMFYLYVPDVDASYQRAINAGAESIAPPADQDYGDRSAGVRDPFGNEWYLATLIREAK